MAPSVLSPINLPQIAHHPGAAQTYLASWVQELAPAPGEQGQRELVLVTGGTTLERLPSVAGGLELLQELGWRITEVRISGEPSAEWVDEQRRRLPPGGGDVVVAIGGGSVLDVGKTLAAMACEEGPTKTYLEGVGDSSPSGKRLPWLAVPTTMGTGSEATHNAVLGRPALEGGYKKSLRHPAFVADRVILDAHLTRTLPRRVVASAGMDAFAQLLESYLAPTSTPLLDRWLLYGLELAGGALPELLRRHGDDDLEAERHDMALAATLSGVALTYTGLGAVHGVIGPLGSLAPIGHGDAAANVLAPAMESTLAAARAAGGDTESFVESRMARIARLIAEDEVPPVREADQADALVATLYRWREEAREYAGLPGLAAAGVSANHVEAVLSKVSERRNPVSLTAEQWRALVEKAL
ncbi:iron-containing alcohol dehydrogenase [Halorhodospira halochloris]|uniref:iron-containing alcohol dehydrogenase n=1 Tax=Halorhodospira halochloris TaxID=1052 RepID=UPI001EE85DE8|nr:iron-containing alcohol dehydrogenase [Halorhodospira halochloris]MCG5548487.1 iron-containing alcohol dehydrogenase [Halorhodospira halochloris]